MQRLRAIFLSDLHLGTADAHSEYLLEMLRRTESDYLFLLGDILDLWKLRSGWHWPQMNNNLFHLLCAKAQQGTRVIYVPGNHDMLMRDYAGLTFSGIEIHNDFIYTAADGRKLLLLHGDEFDGAVKYNGLLTALGNGAYDLLLWLNRRYNQARRWFGRDYWSLAGHLKRQLGNARRYVERFEHAAIHEARRRGVDGVVCGHIHQAGLRQVDDITYANTGDWVESCTALVEDQHGSLRIMRWSRERVLLREEEALPEAA